MDRPVMEAHQFRENGSHYNGGPDFFGYGYDAVGEPRLRMVRRWYRRGARRGQSEDHFSVDGMPVPSYDAALEALRTPAVLTGAERPFLALLTDEPAPRPSGDVETWFRLRAKGFAAAKDRLWSITPAGRAALQAPERPNE